MNSCNQAGYRCVILPGLIAVFLLYLAGGPAIAKAQETASQTRQGDNTNPLCPVLVTEPIDLEYSTIYQGKRVFLCCAMCQRKFERAPEDYLPALPQFSARTATPATLDSTHNDQEHAHTAHENSNRKNLLTKTVAWLGKSHPAAVHFPIALMISALLAELLFLGTRRLFFSIAAQFCVWIGSVSTIAATGLGWFFAGFNLSDPDRVLTIHRWLGTTAGFGAILVLALSVAAARGEGRARWRIWYLLALCITSGTMALNGFLGGALIYGLDHYAW